MYAVRPVLFVRQLCKPFGGGGHMRAAGCSMAMGYAEARDRFIEGIRQYRLAANEIEG